MYTIPEDYFGLTIAEFAAKIDFEDDLIKLFESWGYEVTLWP